jgi:hypothetical protein
MIRVSFLFFAFMVCGLLRAQTNPTVLVLRGGTQVDVASGREISDSTIVIRGERIERGPLLDRIPPVWPRHESASRHATTSEKRREFPCRPGCGLCEGL